MAEREGFEPSEPVRVHLISNQAHSATLPPLQICEKKLMKSDTIDLKYMPIVFPYKEHACKIQIY